MVRMASTEEEEGFRRRIADYLREAVVELEVWRQNARSTQERQSLHRVTALLGQAAGELHQAGRQPDPSQQTLHLAGIYQG